MEGFDTRMETSCFVLDLFRRMLGREFDVPELGLTFYLRTLDSEDPPHRHSWCSPRESSDTRRYSSTPTAVSRPSSILSERPSANVPSTAKTPTPGRRGSDELILPEFGIIDRHQAHRHQASPRMANSRSTNSRRLSSPEWTMGRHSVSFGLPTARSTESGRVVNLKRCTPRVDLRRPRSPGRAALAVLTAVAARVVAVAVAGASPAEPASFGGG